MINIVDEVLNAGATDNKVKYKITHADSTEEIVEIELATPVVTPGTPLNKATLEAMMVNDSDNLTISIPAGTAGGAENTITYNLQTTGKRYILFTISGTAVGGSTLALFDCKTNTFIFNLRITRYMDTADNIFQTNVTEATVSSRNNTNVKLTGSFNTTTNVLTINAKRHNSSSHGSYETTLIGREIGGYIS